MFARSLMIGVAGAALMATGAQAADLFVPETPVEIYDDAGFSFEGLYVGVTGGAAFAGNTYGTLGVVAGVNFAVSDPIVAGLEFELDGVFGVPGVGTVGNAVARGRLGALVTDDVMIYALAGVGVVFADFPGPNDSIGYGEIGAGVEFGLAESVSLRGEVAYLRGFNGGDAGRATAGILFHF